MSGFIAMPSMGDVHRLERELQQLRVGLLAIADALGAALPMTSDVIFALTALAESAGTTDPPGGQQWS